MPNTTAVRTAQVGAAPFFAGKNKIINGDFGVWQRGTTFNSAANNSFTADRFQIAWDSSPTVNASRQTFTPGTAPVAGYEGSYFLRVAETAVSSSTVLDVRHRIEDVRTFAGQTAVISFWAKADSARTLTLIITQDFGSGGSTAVDVTPTTSTFNLTTSWQRFSTTMSVPSISGKTIGTGNNLAVFFRNTASATLVFDLWGVQWEAGSTASSFQTATGTIQGELAACQRYYFRQTAATNAFAIFGFGHARNTTTDVVGLLQAPVEMRVQPTSVDFSTLRVIDGATGHAVTGLTISSECNKITLKVNITVASGLTNYRPYDISADNSTSAYLGFSAEL